MTDIGGPEPIEEYLDELVVALVPLGPRRLRHVLAETEAHLRDAASEGVRQRLSEREAQEQAVARFGPAAALAEDERRATAPGLREMLGHVISSGWRLGALAGIAVGVSGLLAAVVRVVLGAPFLVDVDPGVVLAPADCARWLAGEPAATSCRDAVLGDWTAEIIGSRLLVGILGLLALLAHRALRRRGWLPAGLPGAVDDGVAVTGFAVGALLTLALGGDALVRAAGHGSGQWFSAAAVSLAAVAIFGRRFVADLRHEVISLR